MIKRPNIQSGFTVLELLVVIAIIAILAAVVIVALNASRGKGKDAGIKQQLSEARLQAQLYFEVNKETYCKIKDLNNPELCQWGELGGFPTSCDSNGTVFASDGLPYTIGPMITAANKLSRDPGEDDNGRSCYMDVNGTKWATTLRLNDVDARWCVDSLGVSKLVTGTDEIIRQDITAAGFVCP